MTQPTYSCHKCSTKLQVWYTTRVWRVSHQETTFRTKILG